MSQNYFFKFGNFYTNQLAYEYLRNCGLGYLKCRGCASVIKCNAVQNLSTILGYHPVIF